MSFLRIVPLLAAVELFAGAPPNAADLLSQLPLHFEPLGGRFVARMPGYGLQVNPDGASIVLKKGTVHIRLAGAHEGRMNGRERQAGVSNYFAGKDPANWRQAVPHFGRVRLEGVYPGIDLDFYGTGRQLEYDFLLAPRANASAIGFIAEGASAVRLDGKGDLELQAAGETLHLKAPFAYQLIGGKRTPVASRFELQAGNRIGFALGKYNRELPLVIDPVISFATFIGGNATDVVTAIAVDSSNNICMAGYTTSPNFPVAAAPYRTKFQGGNEEVFIAKLNSLGNQLIFSTFLGGESTERPVGIQVDSLGAITVAGNTNSDNFPLVGAGVASTGIGVFVSRLSGDGSQLTNSILFANTEQQALATATAMTMDATGSVYVTGFSANPQFPLTENVYQRNLNGETDAFLVKFNPTLSAPVYATLLGGTRSDQAYGIALESRGRVLLTGQTNSTNFPTSVGAYTPPARGATDTFVARFNEDGTVLETSAILGGSSDDYGRAITVGPAGHIYVAGYTVSSNMVTTAGTFQPLKSTFAPNAAFITKMPANMESLTYSTYVGATSTYFNVEGIAGIRTDVNDNVILVGSGFGNGLPTTPGAIQSPGPGLSDGFLIRLNSTGEFLTYGTYLGGSNNDQILAMTLDPAGNVYLGGSTSSVNFPVSAGASQTVFGTDVDGFIAKIDFATTSLNCTYSISTANSSIGSAGGTGSFDLTANSGCNWTVASSQPWLIITSPTSGSGNTTVTFRVDANSTTSNRTAVIAAGGKSYNLTQTGAACTLTVDPGNRSVPASSGVFNFSVTGLAGCSWTATSNSSWLRLVGVTSGSGSGLVPLQFEENTTGIPRTGWVTIAKQGVHIMQPAASPQQIFTDVTLAHPFADHIFLLRNANAADNCNGNLQTFCPEATTIRATMAQFIIRSLYNGDNFTYPTTPYFLDVPAQHPQFSYVQKLRELGYTNGCGPTSFCPDQPVTRGQMAAFIIRTRERKRFDQAVTFVPTAFFTDVPTNDIFYGYVQRMKELGITSGCSLTEYCPLGETTRGQMSVFVVRGLLTP